MRKLTALVVAITGLLFLIQALNLTITPISLALAGLPGTQQALSVLVGSIPGVACLALAIYLIMARDRIANWYLTGSDDALHVSAESLLRAGLVLVGVFLVAQAIPALVSFLSRPLASWLQMRYEAGTAGMEVELLEAGLWITVIQNIPAVLAALSSLTIGGVLLAKRETLISRALGTAPVAALEQDTFTAHCPSCGTGYDPSDYDGQFGEPRCEVCKQPLDISRT